VVYPEGFGVLGTDLGVKRLMRTKRVLRPAVIERQKKAGIRMAAGKPLRNILLLRAPNTEFSAIEPHLEFVNFENAARLERDGSPISAVYFLNGGIGSMIVETKDGRSVEVGVAGREDMIGLQLAAGLDEFTYSVVMQVPGDGFRVSADIMKRLLPSLPKLRDLLLRRLGIRSLELAQNAACNRLHNVRQRLARWLLLTHDRIDSDMIRTTHDFLSKMVGADRATVSVAASELERAGVIRQGRASISIENRHKLEAQSCDCYELFRKLNPELGLKTK
jgi:CRP-like cAMP-binding protein